MHNELIIRQPDDWHIHLRDGATTLKETSASVAKSFARAIVMPNLVPAVTTSDQALAYRNRILEALPRHSEFDPLMTLYLTESTTVEEIHKAAKSPYIHACKLYPAGATTNSDAGVKSVENIPHILEAMQETRLPLLIHGEVTDPQYDIFDREKLFIDKVFQKLIQNFPELKCVFEHITTKEAVEFVEASSNYVAATLTIHHLLYNRNHLLAGGIKPHFYCLPVLKRNIHQEALKKAALSSNPKFFLGTDSAPHPQGEKESACGCAGIYSAPAALELYTEFFDENNALEKLEDFASHFGPDFYELPRNKKQIKLVKESWRIPDAFQLGDSPIIPIAAGETIKWKIDDTFEGQLA